MSVNHHKEVVLNNETARFTKAELIALRDNIKKSKDVKTSIRSGPAAYHR